MNSQCMAEEQETRPWMRAHRGRHWWDMPGTDKEFKKLNFYLYRVGRLEVEEIEVDAAAELEEAQYIVAEDGTRTHRRLKPLNRHAQVRGLEVKGAMEGRARGRKPRVHTAEHLAEVAAVRVRCLAEGIVAGFRDLFGAGAANMVVDLRKGERFSPQRLRRLLEMLPQVEARIAEQKAKLEAHHAACEALRARMQILRAGEAVWLSLETGLSTSALGNFKTGRQPTMTADNVKRVGEALDRLPADIRRRTQRPLPGTPMVRLGGEAA